MRPMKRVLCLTHSDTEAYIEFIFVASNESLDNCVSDK